MLCEIFGYLQVALNKRGYGAKTDENSYTRDLCQHVVSLESFELSYNYHRESSECELDLVAVVQTTVPDSAALLDVVVDLVQLKVAAVPLVAAVAVVHMPKTFFT